MKDIGFQRLTKQRDVILKILQRLNTHPTAEEVYNEVKKVLPHISLGTVYRNLEYLSSAGLIKKLNFDSQRRFDGMLKSHAHIVCYLCGKIDDIEMNSIKPLEDISNQMGYDVKSFSVNMFGTCPVCKARKQ